MKINGNYESAKWIDNKKVIWPCLSLYISWVCNVGKKYEILV